MRIFIVEGEHPEVPGRKLSAHHTLAGANKVAADLVNLIAAYMNDCIDPADVHAATPEDWEGVMHNCQDYFGAQYCYVEVSEHEVLS